VLEPEGVDEAAVVRREGVGERAVEVEYGQEHERGGGSSG
jgi:hypothetical protein